jgi:hypothetical protein
MEGEKKGGEDRNINIKKRENQWMRITGRFTETNGSYMLKAGKTKHQKTFLQCDRLFCTLTKI